MKKEILKSVSALLAVSLTATIFVSCGRSGKESEDSLMPTETYVAATVQEMEGDLVTSIIQEVLGEKKWDGDFSKLTEKQRSQIAKKMQEKGYNVKVTDDGIVYLEYVPTADEDEIQEIVQKVLPNKEWDGEYSSLTTEEKQLVQKELTNRGYDVDIGIKGFEFKNEAIRNEETTAYTYNQLPSKEMIAAAVADVIGNKGYTAWDGKMLSLTKEQQSEILQKLNDYGFNLGINEKGEFYMLHSPSNTVTFDKAYTAAQIGGTTQVTTTSPIPREPLAEDLTGTTAAEEILAPVATSTFMTGFGGKSGDGFYAGIADKDGGYVALAQFQSTDGDFAGTDTTWKGMRSALVKFDKNGNYKWKTTIGGTNPTGLNGVTLTGVAQLTDGGYIAVGYTDTRSLGVKKDDAMDAVMLKVSSAGAREWVKLVSGSMADEFLSVAACPDGGYVVGGTTYSSNGDFAGLANGNTWAILTKYNASGEKQWMKAYSGGSNAAQFSAVAVTEQGAVYASCNASVALGSHLMMDMAKIIGSAGCGKGEAMVMKFTADGQEIAVKPICGSGTDEIKCLTLAPGGGVVIGGASTRNNNENSVFAGHFCQGDSDAFVIRLDEKLNTQWVKCFGGIAHESVLGIVPVKGGFAAVGRSMSSNGDFGFLSGTDQDGFLITISENGTGAQTYAMGGDNRDICYAVAGSDKKIAVFGLTSSATNHFSSISPVPASNPICFMELFEVK